MSADNWRQCPKCLIIRRENVEKSRQKIDDAYGKVSVAKYHLLVAEHAELEKKKVPETLREDYEMGMKTTGDFFCCYGCSCETCGFSFNYNHKQIVEVKTP